ncbi:MAG: hypoxanthine phosphoribosyltransferase [Tannerellaceae bacterium]|nr:hypoxanthine phosphoribosyltransferase [Porphyromonadaceae bacterium]
MERIRLHDKEFAVYIKDETIQAQIKRLADEIRKDVADKNPLFVVVLNGAFMFASDLLKELNVPFEVTFMRCSSYAGTSSTGEVKEIIGLGDEIKGRTLVFIEDIVDSGLTMQTVLENVKARGVAEARLATLFLKPKALKCDLKPEYVGFEIDNEFIVGYGLDYDEMGRAYRDIYKIVAE